MSSAKSPVKNIHYMVKCCNTYFTYKFSIPISRNTNAEILKKLLSWLERITKKKLSKKKVLT